MSKYQELAWEISKFLKEIKPQPYYIFAMRKEVHLFGKRLFRQSTLTSLSQTPKVPNGWTLGKCIASWKG